MLIIKKECEIMLQFIKINYLSQTKLSINLVDFTKGIFLALFQYFLGQAVKINLGIILLFVSLGIIRAAMALYCIIKFRTKNNSK